MTNIIKNTFTVILSFLILSSAIILIVLWTFSNSIPDYRFLKNYKPPVSSKMYSGEGELVADFSKEKRIFIPYEAIPQNVINSLLSAEDKNFFNHPGIDAKGVLRATIKNLKNISGNKRLEGAYM
jgi:penicillin-binding protein 1A